MTITKQQEALLFTLTFPQKQRLYSEFELTSLEQELFSRLKEKEQEYDYIEDILSDYSIDVETLDHDLGKLVGTIEDLKIDLENQKDELLVKQNKIDSLLDEISELKNKLSISEGED